MGMELPSLSEMGMQIHGNNMARGDYITTKEENRRHDIKMFDRTSAFNKEEAKKGRDFSERMDNTRMQRGIKDMEAAGINPLLAIGGGGSPGASTASASGSASPNSSSAPNVAEGLVSTAQQGKLVSNATKKLEEELKNIKAQNKNIGAQTAKTKKETSVLNRKDTQEGLINDGLKFLQKKAEQASQSRIVKEGAKLPSEIGDYFKRKKEIWDSSKFIKQRKSIKMKGPK